MSDQQRRHVMTISPAVLAKAARHLPPGASTRAKIKFIYDHVLNPWAFSPDDSPPSPTPAATPRPPASDRAGQPAPPKANGSTPPPPPRYGTMLILERSTHCSICRGTLPATTLGVVYDDPRSNGEKGTGIACADCVKAGRTPKLAEVRYSRGLREWLAAAQQQRG
jgi:hypothetical protein